MPSRVHTLVGVVGMSGTSQIITPVKGPVIGHKGQRQGQLGTLVKSPEMQQWPLLSFELLIPGSGSSLCELLRAWQQSYSAQKETTLQQKFG